MPKPGLVVPLAFVAFVSVRAESPVKELPVPPQASAVPKTLTLHGQERIDPFYWMKERENPAVLSYLEAENAYLDAVMADTEDLQETLFQEITGRMEKDPSSVPVKRDDYFYYVRYEAEREYPIWARKRGSLDAEEQILRDLNELAEGHDYYSAWGPVPSSDHKIIAYAVDTAGRNMYTIQFYRPDTGETLPDRIEDVTPYMAWARDGKTLFYTAQDPETLREDRIYRHELGTDPADDVLIYEEKDPTFSVYVWLSKSREFVMIYSSHTLSSELRMIDAAKPREEPRLVIPRRREHEFMAYHYQDSLYIRTNSGEAENFRVVKAPLDDPREENWEEVIAHRPDVLIEDLDIFRDHLVLAERKNGLPQIRIRSWDGQRDDYLDFGEPAYFAYLGDNPEYDTSKLRYFYSSLTTPWSVYEFDVETGERTLLKRDKVLGDFAPENYKTLRLYARARDGVAIPISLVYRKTTDLEGQAPLLLEGYGAYGASYDASFRGSLLSLLDRGFVFALAHVRGGQELGRQWYEDGKLQKKMNTFTDFIDCAEFLVAARFTSPDRLFATGGSAGGLLMGVIANLRPDLFHGIINDVPFVDVITTMSDPDIPLTTAEYDEWGDPNDKEEYDYILSYSPYDQLKAKAYPNMLVTTGFHDSQVQYWEPAKYVAKLRTLKTDDNLLLLKTNLEAGHSGKTGRFQAHRDTALAWAFLLKLVEAAPAP